MRVYNLNEISVIYQNTGESRRNVCEIFKVTESTVRVSIKNGIKDPMRVYNLNDTSVYYTFFL